MFFNRAMNSSLLSDRNGSNSLIYGAGGNGIGSLLSERINN
jgi:hypothetical protein